MPAWSAFYSGTAGAAAALLGLLFVAVSVIAASDHIVQDRTAQALAEQALGNYTTTLLVSLVALMPDMSLRDFGVVSVALAALPTLLTGRRLFALMRRPPERGRFTAFRRHGASFAALLILLTASALLASGSPQHLSLMGTALMVLLFSATMASWELMLAIARRGGASPPQG